MQRGKTKNMSHLRMIPPSEAQKFSSDVAGRPWTAKNHRQIHGWNPYSKALTGTGFGT